MATLRALAAQVCDALNRPYDHMMIERVKDMILQSRLTMLHRTINKYGVDGRYLQSYVADLQRINLSQGTVQSPFTVLRTVNKIPSAIRYESDVPFNFVGSVDRTVSFSYIKLQSHRFINSLRYIGNAIKWDYKDNYLYLYNTTKPKQVLIELLPEALDVNNLGIDPLSLCLQDDYEFPLSGDLLNAVITEVLDILRKGNDIANMQPVTHRDNE